MKRGTSVAHVHEVVAIEDRVLRNYWVTQTYADISTALAKVLNPSTANWCTFATWASSTVGRNLRGEDLPEWLHDRVVLGDGMMGAVREVNERKASSSLASAWHDLSPDHVFDVAREGFGASAMSLSVGNTEVFAEIAPVAATFIECYSRHPVDADAARRRVLDACEGALLFEGVNRLRAGFSLWCDAMAETDAMRHSQLILAGSLELGAHEQNHLQGAIAGSMDMGIDQSVRLLEQRLTKRGRVLARFETSVADALHPVVRAIGDLWGDLMTEILGTIHLPDTVLRLDHDVPPVPGEPFIPADVDHVVVDELDELLKRFDQSTADGLGSRAIDWVKLDDRMNFITNLFRSRHHRLELFEPPFPPDVLKAIQADRLPGSVRTAPKAPAAPGASSEQAPLAGSPALRALADKPGCMALLSPLRRDERPTRTAPPSPAAPTVGLTRFTDRFLEELRNVGDEPADTAVTTFFEKTGSKHSELFRKLARSSSNELPDEELPGVGAFVNAVEQWPAWADQELVSRGQRVFGDWGPQLGMGLWMASLPADYACAKGAEPLVRTARLTRNPKRRYLETGQMIIDAMTPKGLDAGARGYRTVRHVRLMHAAVRHVLSHATEVEGAAIAGVGAWDRRLGKPVNQEDLLGCLFSFSVVGIDSLGRSGVRLSADDAEAYVHAWNVVGHQIGIREDLLPLDWSDAQDLWEVLKQRQYKASDAGRELTAAAISCMQEMLDMKILRGLPATGIRHYLGDDTADLLGVPPADWTKHFFTFVEGTDGIFAQTVRRLPGSNSMLAALGRRMLRGFESCERDGDRPTFQISDELKQAWGMSL